MPSFVNDGAGDGLACSLSQIERRCEECTEAIVSTLLMEDEMNAGFPLSFAVNAQPDIHDAENRRDHEAAAFAEVKAVLAKHGLLRKYGIALLHKHFDLAEDEILVEYTDVENRTQMLMPTKVGAVRPTDLVETVWALDLDTAALICQTWCYFYGGANAHQVNHRQSG